MHLRDGDAVLLGCLLERCVAGDEFLDGKIAPRIGLALEQSARTEHVINVKINRLDAAFGSKTHAGVVVGFVVPIAGLYRDEVLFEIHKGCLLAVDVSRGENL